MSIIRQRKLRIEKMKKYVVAGGILLLILLIILGIYLTESRQVEEATKAAGMDPYSSASVVESKETEKEPLQMAGAFKGHSLTADMRRRCFDGILTDPSITMGDCVDIRIRFANGLDFVVLTQKEITGISPSGNGAPGMSQVEFIATEEEMLRMSSAYLDVAKRPVTRLYAAEYIQSQQEAARPNYPMDSLIKELLYEDPNVTKAIIEPEESKLRHSIEELPQEGDGWEEDESQIQEETQTQDPDTAQKAKDANEEFFYVE